MTIDLPATPILSFTDVACDIAFKAAPCDVRSVLEAGVETVGDRGKFIASETIARPHDDVLRIFLNWRGL
jgi:microcompartment protein CcmL/EutN